MATIILLTATAHANPKLEINPVGSIKTTYAQFDWELKDLGDKKTHATMPIVEVQYKGTVLPANDYVANIMGRQKGNIPIIKPTVPAGKHKVKLKVRPSQAERQLGCRERTGGRFPDDH